MLGFWNFRRTPARAIADSLDRTMSVKSSKITRPCFGRVMPEITSSRVVLPAPFGPITARTSPKSIASDNMSIALKLPNSTVTERPTTRQRSSAELRRFGEAFGDHGPHELELGEIDQSVREHQRHQHDQARQDEGP